MKEVEIRGKTYRIGKLDAFAQMYVLKRAVPVLGQLKDIFAGYDPDEPASAEKVLPPLSRAVGELPDESLAFVCNAALDVTAIRQPGGGWAQMRRNGQLMYADLDLLTLLTLTAHALTENLGDFFRALPSFSNEAGEAEAETM